MVKNKLGLPLEYSTLHNYYDMLSSDDSDAKNRVIENILRKHNVKTVLDLTCGTGSQVLYLAKQGYQVTGADLSPALLAQAKEKAQKEKLDIHFIEGNMRTLQVGKFDAVITIFNAIGHLTKAGFEKALKNIGKNLNDGGLYVFDILNLDAMTDSVVNNLAMDLRKTVNNTQIHAVQYSEINRENGHLTSYDTFTIQEGSDEPKTFKGKFTLQIYTAPELREMLARNGFETLSQYDLDGSKFLEHTTTTILTVAKKRS